MPVLKKITAIFQILETIFELFRAYVQVRLTHFSNWSHMLVPSSEFESSSPSGEQSTLARLVCARIARIGKPGGEHLSCLIKAIAAKRMLSRRSIATTVKIGINKAGGATGGLWEAHAWLDLGDRTILGGDTKAEYVRFRRQGESSVTDA
jgi:hypothetical protein